MNAILCFGIECPLRTSISKIFTVSITTDICVLGLDRFENILLFVFIPKPFLSFVRSARVVEGAFAGNGASRITFKGDGKPQISSSLRSFPLSYRSDKI